MRVLATPRFPILGFALVALFAFVGARAEAQIDPYWDHYKVYEAFPHPPGPAGVFLRDQFTQTTHAVEFLEKFMNPVEKVDLANGATYTIFDPLLHYTWWRITSVPFDAQVAFDNQFGGGSVHLFRAAYLLNPALKNQVNLPLPLANHYKCYECQGQPVTRPLRLIDQFDIWQVDQMFPRYFCTPTEKQTAGETHLIVDPKQHYVCYEFQPPDPNPFPAFIRDQFIQTSLELRPGHMICVPTDKLVITNTATGQTWGRLKLLYR
jgi:hypothetical protein